MINRNILLNYQISLKTKQECTAIIPYKEADCLTQIPWDNNQVVDVIAHNNSSIFRLPGESVSDASKRCFVPYQIFGSVHELKSKVDTFSIEWGFRATCYGYHIHCNWFGKPPKTVKNKFARKSIKRNCQWLIKFTFLDQRKKDSVKITLIFPHHTNTCTPSKDQLVIVRTAAGDYRIFTIVLKDLIKSIDLNYFVNFHSIHELLQRDLNINIYILVLMMFTMLGLEPRCYLNK